MFEHVSRLVKGEGSAKANEFVAKADAARNTRDWEDAAKLYRAALDADPAMADIWVQYGHALKESGNYEQAEGAYKQSLQQKNAADTHLQLGHLLKITNRRADALKSYRRALELMPDDPAIRLEIEGCEKNLGTRFYAPQARRHIYFDISDLIFYIGHHDNLTGIQRVQASIVLGLLDLEFSDLSVHFLTYVNSNRAFFEIDQKFFVSLLHDLALGPESRKIEFDKLVARDGYMREAALFKPLTNGENVLCLLGAAWVNRDYFLRLRNLKQEGNFRVLFLIHDLIPIYARETCDQGTAEVFTEFLLQSYQIVERYLCVSQNTKSDLIRYFGTFGWRIPEPIVTENGTLAADVAKTLPTPKSLDPELEAGDYILFVSTIEGRKNHIAAFKAYEQLLAQRQNVPYLVCVGRLGWRAEDFLLACETTNFLGGKIKIFSEVSDMELIALYKNCLFTIYPSLYEGWGLPVGESLAFGKTCIVSKTSSLPEVGKEFATYVDPEKPNELATAISNYLDDPSLRKRAEEKIAASYLPVEWKDVGSKIIDACFESLEQPLKSPLPMLDLGREYPVSVMPQLPKNLMGERMAEAISVGRRRALLPGLHKEEDYRLGQSARLGEGWCEPETGFTWARTSNAAIAFRLPVRSDDGLLVYLTYQATEPCVGSDLIVESGRGMSSIFRLKQPSGRIVINGIRPVQSPKTGEYYVMRFKITSSEDLEARLSALDGRSPAFAIRSFAVVDETDTKTRLFVLERALLT